MIYIIKYIVIFFISLTKCKYILYIDDMFIEKDKNQENNYSIIFNIKRLNISEKIIINNLFKVVYLLILQLMMR